MIVRAQIGITYGETGGIILTYVGEEKRARCKNKHKKDLVVEFVMVDNGECPGIDDANDVLFVTNGEVVSLGFPCKVDVLSLGINCLAALST